MLPNTWRVHPYAGYFVLVYATPKHPQPRLCGWRCRFAFLPKTRKVVDWFGVYVYGRKWQLS